MTDHRPHWLEWAEYATLGFAFITLLASIASGIWFLPLLFTIVTLGLNILNRLRWQAQQRRRLTGLARQLQSQWEEERTALSGQIETSRPRSSPPPSSLPENIIALEQSLNGIVQYLNHHALRERVEHLERSYGQIRRELFNLTDISEENIPEPIEAIESRIVLPTLNLTASSFPSDVPRWECIRTIEAHREAIAAIALTPDDRFLLSVGRDRALKVWDFATGNLVTSIDAHDSEILALAVTGEGEAYSVATGGFDRTVKWWTFRADDPRLQLEEIFLGHEGSIHGLGFAPRSRLLVSAGYDKTLKQWSLDKGEETASMYDSLGAIYALGISPREDFIAAGGGDGTVTLWRVGSGEKLAVLAGNVSSVLAIDLSRDGTTIAAGCVDGTVKLWSSPPDAGNILQPIRVLNAHSGQVTALRFAREGQWLFSGGTDGQIAVWQSNYQQAIVTIPVAFDRSRSVSGIAESADGNYLVSACGDGSIGIWQRME
ncbi:WD40 repeat domain-containing protein [Pannus brasiliensis CCIBt3594]|uniref:WD40 repeat domain-containing protein n=1 Tax=Pannus brasiliensis CCIBt3594 TaxID=1427578 RepID=A0AAW9QVR3_9CHRO